MTHDAAGKQKPPVFRRLAPFMVLSVLLAASVWLWQFWDGFETTRAQDAFERHCREICRDIAVRLNACKMTLQGGAGVFLASEEASREKWRAYVEYRAPC